MKQQLTPEAFAKLARELPRDERVPFAFEKRVMAHLSAGPAVDSLALWTNALWRAVGPCLAIMAFVAAISFSQSNQAADDMDAALERAVMAVPEATFDLGA